MIIAPSLLAANFQSLEQALKQIEDARWLHLDVMDGHFVPNLSFGPMVIEAIRPLSEHVFDTHLMVANPGQLVDAYIEAGSDRITFHVEVDEDTHALIDYLKTRNTPVGLSVKPNTHVDQLLPYIERLDHVLIMSVEPGFGGQSFIEHSLEKIRQLKILRTTHDANFLISVDGGINATNVDAVVDAGADICVIGSSIFKAADPVAALKALYDR
jgi:ribulose-phosphate 3-epimerase